MTLVHERMGNWPGFGYTDAEKEEMKALDKTVPSLEFYTWVTLVVVLSITIFGIIVYLGTVALMAVIGGEEHMKDTPATLFFFVLYFEVVVCLCCVLPIVMVLSSGIVGRLRGVPLNLLPDRATTARLFRKVWFQIIRMTLVLGTIALLYWLFVPTGSKLDLLVRFIAPMLAPLVAILSSGWFLAGRLGR